MWRTLIWISQYYITPIGKVLKTALPNIFKQNKKNYVQKYVQIISPKNININLFNNKPAQKRVIQFLCNNKNPIKLSELNKLASQPGKICNNLKAKGLIKIFNKQTLPTNTTMLDSIIQNKIKLSDAQQHIINQINYKKTQYNPILLHGVTGSGKTEIYIKLTKHILNTNKSIIILVPEIALTPQIATKFFHIFGNIVTLWHSKQTQAEKTLTWNNLKNGNYKIVIGARSAIFSPIKNLGLIIVDEEHEPSYKQENVAPRYHARDVAMIRGKLSQSIVILGSATPSIESYYNAIQKKYTYLQLAKRYGASKQPNVEIISMINESNNNVFSTKLINEIKKCIAKSEQIILLVNRRGYNLTILCADCGFYEICNNCSITMKLHKTDNKLHCHYCKITKNNILACSQCKSESLKYLGSGTQKIEETLKHHFKNIKILRMDFDSTRTKNSYSKIINQFAKGEANILIGTQMIAKGLDFDNVTLVGVINADNGLFFPDFRAGERVFQLIYQVVGRSGRRKKLGKAIIQTYNPNDIYIQSASKLNTKKFYNIALSQRQQLHYPPFSRIARIIFTSKNKVELENISNLIYKKLIGDEKIIILGPTLAPIEKINKIWRIHLIIKNIDKNLKSIHQFLFNKIGFDIFVKQVKSVKIKIDIDPISMM